MGEVQRKCKQQELAVRLEATKFQCEILKNIRSVLFKGLWNEKKQNANQNKNKLDYLKSQHVKRIKNLSFTIDYFKDQKNRKPKREAQEIFLEDKNNNIDCMNKTFYSWKNMDKYSMKNIMIDLLHIHHTSVIQKLKLKHLEIELVHYGL